MFIIGRGSFAVCNCHSWQLTDVNYRIIHTIVNDLKVLTFVYLSLEIIYRIRSLCWEAEIHTTEDACPSQATYCILTHSFIPSFTIGN